MQRTAAPSPARSHRALPALLAGLVALAAACARPAAIPERAPRRLADTGLYADFNARTIADGVLTFTPQYPLWTDGATKRRWIALPQGSSIDATDVDDWVFPVGTRLWKEFAFGRAVETRFMLRRADGSWLFATYVWTPDGSDAVLAPEAGVRSAIGTAEGQSHDIPSLLDCRLCHENGRSPVLGFGALQLSSDRDPEAPHAAPPGPDDVDLRSLVARGLVANLPEPWATTPPRIAAASAQERAALGYLHGNCSSCHNASGPLHRLGMRLDHPLAAAGQAPAIATTVDVASQFTRPGATKRIAPGSPDRSVLVHRLRATDPVTQMPPFGRHLADRSALELVERWVTDLASTPITAAVPNSSNKKE